MIQYRVELAFEGDNSSTVLDMYAEMSLAGDLGDTAEELFPGGIVAVRLLSSDVSEEEAVLTIGFDCEDEQKAGQVLETFLDALDDHIYPTGLGLGTHEEELYECFIRSYTYELLPLLITPI
jgi:hypothetical protein